MKNAVINFSGNVGKSTVARHLLAPRMNNCDVISVETINSDDHDGEQVKEVKGKEFANIIEAMLFVDDMVVDVGASNVEQLIQQMKQYRGSHEDFDLFIIPTTPVKKQQRDTISTIEALAEIGVPARKIRLLFNMVEPDDDVREVFSGLFDYHEAEKSFVLNPNAVLRTNPIYSKLTGAGMTISEVLADPTDYKAMIKDAKDVDEKLRLSAHVANKRLAIGVKDQLDAAYKALVK